MTCEEGFLLGNGLPNRDLVDDVLLGTVLDTDEAETQMYLLVHNHFLCVCAAIHDIDLSDYTDCADTFRIQLECHLQTI